jgi:hypothetical protein
MKDLRSSLKINKFRSLLYFIAKLLGDINAVQKGRIGRRIGVRAVGKITGRLIGRLFK